MNGPPLDPHLFIVFGGSGDLMRRKIIPALFHLTASGHLGQPGGPATPMRVLAVARRSRFDDEAFRQWARVALAEAGLCPVDAPRCPGPEGSADAWCDECLSYFALGEERPEDFRRLGEHVRQLERDLPTGGNRALYLALPPAALGPLVEGLAHAGLTTAPGWTRVVTEKPFGHDLASARQIDAALHRYFDETQIYRIDHYLGKETVQNLMVLRFANPIFESLWSRDHVKNVQITVGESAGIGSRAGYYDGVGAVRDMVQNHLTQLLALLAMEVPAVCQASDIHDEKAKVLRSIAPILQSDIVLGQYGPGAIAGSEVPGYLQEEGIPPGSRTETFAAVRLNIANWRWEGVPFFLRTGKRLPRTARQIVVTFRRAPLAFFCPFSACNVHSNTLTITLEPDEGFEISFEVKAPGQPFTLQTHSLHFRYDEVFGRLPEAYETLLLEMIRGDQTLFVRGDAVDYSWQLYSPLLEQELPVLPYAAGTWGPPEATRLLTQEGAAWQIS